MCYRPDQAAYFRNFGPWVEYEVSPVAYIATVLNYDGFLEQTTATRTASAHIHRQT